MTRDIVNGAVVRCLIMTRSCLFGHAFPVIANNQTVPSRRSEITINDNEAVQDVRTLGGG